MRTVAAAAGGSSIQKAAEEGKLLALRLAGVDGEPARRNPVNLSLGDRPEIGGALEHREFVEIVAAIDRIAQAETRIMEIEIARGLRHQGPEGEEIGQVIDARICWPPATT